ncbi:MAG TPA: NADH-quinone oxidoreductase subunit J [Anaerolineae bacterium]|nr:NADH-quinone oxidoreductase subunit J [Anaerolineae bacterium]
MTLDLILFFGIAFIAVVSAISMLISRNAIYSALFLVLNFVAIASLYLLLNAAFIAMVQVTVYAGAIMVLFLFVIMLLGAERVETSPSLPWQLPVAILLGLVLVAEFAYVLFGKVAQAGGELTGVGEGFGSPASVGRMLFDQYLIPFEVTSILLLVAMVGAIVLTRDDRKGSR